MSPRQLDIAAIAFLAAIWALTFLPRLGEREVTNVIEARVGITAREMWRAGEWVLPTMNGVPRLQKPPLAYWAVESLACLRGTFDDTTLRLPFAVFALGGVAFTWAMGRRLGGRRRGLTAGVVLLTSALFIKGARTASADIALFCAVAGAWHFYLSARLTPRPGSRVLLWALLALGWLAKGPVILALVLIPALVETVFSRSWRPLRPFASGLGIVLFLVVGLSWPLAVIWRLADQLPPGQAVHRWFLESFGKILPSDGIEDGYKFQRHSGEIYFYVLRFPVVIGIWTLLLIPWLDGFIARRGWRSFASALRAGDAAVLPSLWLLTTLVFFSLVSEKKTPYVLPLLPAASLWLAAVMDNCGELWLRRLGRLAPGLGVLAIGAALILLWPATGGVLPRSPALFPENWCELLERIARDQLGPALGLSVLGLFLAWILRQSSRQPTTVPAFVLVGATLGLGGFLYDGIRDDLEPRPAFRQAGSDAREALAGVAEPIALGNLPASLIYYLDRAVRVLDAKDPKAIAGLSAGAVVLSRERTLEQLGMTPPLPEGTALGPPLQHFRVQKLIDAGSGSQRDRVLVLVGK